MEANYKSKLDSLQTLLTELCKDESLELVLRLKVLEVIELRTMGWRASSSAAQYYRERIPQDAADSSEGELQLRHSAICCHHQQASREQGRRGLET